MTKPEQGLVVRGSWGSAGGANDRGAVQDSGRQ